MSQILDHLQTTAKAVTASEIARAAGAPISTIYVLVEEMLDKCLLDRVSSNKVWLGPQLFHYGLAYGRSLDLLNVVTQAMEVLARTVGETVQICGRDGDRMVVLAMVEDLGTFA